MGRTNRRDRDDRGGRGSRDRDRGNHDHREVHGRLEGGDGTRTGRFNPRNAGGQHDRPREPRQWDHENTVEEGNVRLTITSSVFHNERVRSYDFSRIFRGRPSRFFRKEDLLDLITVCEQVLQGKPAESA